MSANKTSLLTGVTTTGAGPAVQICGVANIGVQVVFTNSGGSCTALVVAIEGSLDGVNYQALTTAHTFSGGELTAKAALFAINNFPVDYIRANVTTLTQTGTTTINAFYLEEKIYV